LIVTEIVTNALVHGGPGVVVWLHRRGGRLHGEVFDGNREWPRGFDSALSEESGRGLRIVDAVADAWGVEQRDVGKAVWFDVDAEIGD
jgi:two-component sensor histidine kinase